MAKKKQEKRGNETKKKVWLIINFAIIMAIGVLIAIGSEVIGTAYVAGKSAVDPDAEKVVFNLTTEIIKEANTVLNRNLALSVGVYGLIQLFNYILYILKKKKVLVCFALLELILGIIGFIMEVDYFLYGLPLISALIYLRVLKLEEA